MFPCRRRHGCGHCSPIWKNERDQWYLGIMSQWGETVYVWRTDENVHDGKNDVDEFNSAAADQAIQEYPAPGIQTPQSPASISLPTVPAAR